MSKDLEIPARCKLCGFVRIVLSYNNQWLGLVLLHHDFLIVAELIHLHTASHCLELMRIYTVDGDQSSLDFDQGGDIIQRSGADISQ